MADLRSLSLPLRTFLKVYPWRRVEPLPWSPLRKALAQANVALITTAGLFTPEQVPFDESIRGGDTTFRTIGRDTSLASLDDAHRSDAFDRSGLEADLNLVFPVDRLRELEGDGVIGSMSARAISFMGSITAPGRLQRETAPAAADVLVTDGVEAALLVPV